MGKDTIAWSSACLFYRELGRYCPGLFLRSQQAKEVAGKQVSTLIKFRPQTTVGNPVGRLTVGPGPQSLLGIEEQWRKMSQYPIIENQLNK